jgi:thiosulfate/3-mercaptopyruvate sulfurtransferase
VDVTTEELARRLGEPGLVVVDVRSAAEFAGLSGAPCDPRQGHIPGALHVDVNDLMSRDADAVRELVGLPAGSEIVTYCHSGSRSAIAAMVLRAAGFEARNYTGSWHEWSRDDGLPAE